MRYLGKLGPGGKVIFFFHLDECHIDVALCVWHKGVFTRVLGVVQNFSLTAVEGKGVSPT